MIYAFHSKRADRLKLLFFDGTGVVLVAKRLEAGAFRWPKPGDTVIQLTASERATLFEGLDWARVHVPRTTMALVAAGCASVLPPLSTPLCCVWRGPWPVSPTATRRLRRADWRSGSSSTGPKIRSSLQSMSSAQCRIT